MKLKINNIEYKIKPACLLTCKEFIELSKTNGTIIDYISVVTGLTFKSIADIKFNELTLNRLHSYIQTVQRIENLERDYLFYYSKDKQIVTEKTFNFDSVGTVFLMQSRAETTTNNYELMVYMLAIAIQQNYDADKIEEIYTDLLNESYIKVFSFINFFFRNFVNGLNKRNSSLIMRIKEYIINILLKLKR